MKKVNIKLSAIADIRNFVDIATKYPNDIDLSSGRYIVDAKSIMGIFSLDLMQPIELTAHGDDTDKLFEELADYIIKE